MEKTAGDVSIMVRLRDETRAQHESAEQRPLEKALAAGSLPRDGYVALLGQRFLIHAVMEGKVRTLAASDARVRHVVHEALFQEANLRADLEHFGVKPEAVEPCPGTSRLISAMEEYTERQPVALLGVYYVFEGSKNGARFVAQRLRSAYGLEGAAGLNYFDPHGSEQRALWRAFKERMDGCPFEPEEADAIVSAAKLTFDMVGAIDDELMAALGEPPVTR